MCTHAELEREAAAEEEFKYASWFWCDDIFVYKYRCAHSS